VLELTLVGIRLGRLQRGGDLGLLGLQIDDLLFQHADILPELADLARGRLGLGRGRGNRCGFLRLGLLGAAVGEAGRDRGAGVAQLGFLQVIIVVAGVVRQTAAVHMQHILGEGLDEMHVVRDENQSPWRTRRYSLGFPQ